MIHDERDSFAVFSPQTVAAINRAYGAAVAVINSEGHHELRGRLAEHIMVLARNGERDEQRLSELSVLAVLGRAPDRGNLQAPRERPAVGD